MIHLDGEIGTAISIDSIANVTASGTRELSLTTDGGSIYNGKGMYDYAIANNTLDTIFCYGMVASAGTIFLLSAKNRIGSPNSKFLIHPPSGAVKGDLRQFEKVTASLKEEEEWLINFYVDTLQKEDQSKFTHEEIKDLLMEQKVLSANEALKIGLITEILNFENMAENVTKEDLKTFENSFLAKIINFFKPQNMVVQSTDGTELEFESTVESPSQIAVGQKLLAGGSPADGTYILADGTKVVAVAGVIETVEAPADDNAAMVEDLKQQIEALKNEKTELQNKLEVAVIENTAAKGLVNELKEDFVNFKNRFSDDTPPAGTPPAGDGNEPVNKFSFRKK